MKIDIKLWSEVSDTNLEGLFLNNPYPIYRGTPLANNLMKKYMFMLAKENARQNDKNAIVVFINNKPIMTGQIFEVPHLSKFWNKSIANIGHMVTDSTNNELTFLAAKALIDYFLKIAKKNKISFLSLNVPGPNIMLIRALEEKSFKYAEGFLNMVGSTNEFRQKFSIPGLKIREPVESDFNEIFEVYQNAQFPSRFTTDGGFDSKKAFSLYANRFREVHKNKLGKIFIAEINEKFAGALIALIDKKMEKMIGIKTNSLSGMGIIIHPRAYRRGISLAMIEHRQDYYKSEGVEYINFGANFNNLPMLRGLAKLGLQYGGIDVTFHQWI